MVRLVATLDGLDGVVNREVHFRVVDRGSGGPDMPVPGPAVGTVVVNFEATRADLLQAGRAV